MANWVKLTHTSNKPIWLNLDRAISIAENTKPTGTWVSFVRGNDPESVVVLENFEDVARSAQSPLRA
jgi:hypothetical protein